MQIVMNVGGMVDTNAYLVADEDTRQAVLFDAPNDTVAPLLDEAQKQGYDLVGLWLTHGHFDHIADHRLVTDRFPRARLLMHAADEPKLTDPRSQRFALPFVIPPGRADAWVSDGQALRVGRLDVEVIHTPGHSPGHVAYYFPGPKVLIGGDLIIMGAVGRTDLPDADFATLQQSIRRVMRLPKETRLLPGHGQPTTLEQELLSNLHVREAMEGG